MVQEAYVSNHSCFSRLIASCQHTCDVWKMSLEKAGKIMLRDKGWKQMVTASVRSSTLKNSLMNGQRRLVHSGTCEQLLFSLLCSGLIQVGCDSGDKSRPFSGSKVLSFIFQVSFLKKKKRHSWWISRSTNCCHKTVAPPSQNPGSALVYYYSN